MRLSVRQLARLGGLALALGGLLWGCGGGSGSAVPSVAPQVAAPPWALRSTDDAGVAAYFRDAFGPTGARNFMIYATGAAGDVPSPVPGAGGITFSGTTLQEAGVDEADLIKSDGAAVFSLDRAGDVYSNRRVLRRQKLTAAAASLLPVDSLAIPFSADVPGTGMYLDSDRQQLAVIGERSTFAIYDSWFSSVAFSHAVTQVALVDAPSAGALKTRRMLQVNAALLGSRRIGSTLYLVLRSSPQLPGLDPFWPPDKTASNQKILDSLSAAQVLPSYSIDGGAEQPLVQASSCMTQDGNVMKTADVITIMAVDLGASTHKHAARCFVGGTEAFYMSDQSLYLATTRSGYSMSGSFAVYTGQSSTDVHKFALDGLDMAYRGSGNVVGHLGFDQNRKSFRMGEYNGALRVVTQTQSAWVAPLPPVATPVSVTASAPGATTATTTVTAALSPAHLTILKEDGSMLGVVGELPNANRPQPLGKAGEQLYASRFLGSRGYIVTYRQIDPLYVLDLSNPADPKVAGELQVEGYSDYLFPLSENLLLGVGKDAISDGSSGDGRFAWYQGVKVSLIDISDPSKPLEAARSIIGHRGTGATVLRDHHGIALQATGGTVRVSLPVSLNDTPPAGATGAPSDYYDFTRNELRRFEVNLGAKTLTPRAPLAEVPSQSRDIADDRSLLWSDQVHWYRGGEWTSSGW